MDPPQDKEIGALTAGPLVWAAALYMGGILLARVLPLPPASVLGLAAFGAVIALLSKRGRELGLGALVFLTGCAAWTCRTAIVSPDDLRRLTGIATNYVRLEGVLSETPTQRIFDANTGGVRTMALLDASRIEMDGARRNAHGRVLAATPGTLAEEFHAGQKVSVTGVLRPPRGAPAEGLFDYRRHLESRLIFHQLTVQKTNDWELLPPRSTGLPVTDLFLKWARQTLALGLPEEDETLHLLWAMGLGLMTEITNEVSRPFMRTGTLHIFAISGLHIALLSGILISVLRVARLSRAKCSLVALPVIWFYTIATGLQPSAVRSSLMMTVVILGWSWRRPPSLLNSLAASSLLILIFQPEQLFQASFQLSFFVVLGMALLTRPIEAWLARPFRVDPYLPWDCVPLFRQRLIEGARFGAAALAVSTAAFLGSLPLIGHYFSLVTPNSILVNLLVVPLSNFALASTLASLLSGAWWPALAEIFNHSGWLLMRSVLEIAQWVSARPVAFYIPQLSALQCAALYLAIGLAAWGLSRSGSLRRRLAGLSLSIIFAGAAFWPKADRACRITVLPTGGASTFIDRPGRADDLLLDCGGSMETDFIVTRFLQAKGINTLPNFLLTHGDVSHVDGADKIISGFSVPHVYLNPLATRSPRYRQISAWMDQWPSRKQLISPGEEIAGFQVLHPSGEETSRRGDDVATVLAGTQHGWRVLLLSELGRSGQAALMGRVDENALQADIVFAGLPNVGEPLEPALLSAIKPRAVVIQDRKFGRPGRAPKILRQRFQKAACPIFYLADEDAITVTLTPELLEIKTMAGTQWKARKMPVADGSSF